MRLLCCVLFILMGWTGAAQAQPDVPSALEALKKSVAFHDPQGNWADFQAAFRVLRLRPDKRQTMQVIKVSVPGHFFGVEYVADSMHISYGILRDTTFASVNQNANIPADLMERFHLSDQDIRDRTDLHLLIMGMPMSLYYHPAAELNKEVFQESFQGKESLMVSARLYNELWMIHLDPATFSVLGFEWMDDVATESGQYVEPLGIQEVSGIKFPAERHWYRSGGSTKKLLFSEFMVAE